MSQKSLLDDPNELTEEEIAEEMSRTVIFIDSRVTLDILTSFEAVLFLRDKPLLLGVYTSLLLLNQTKMLNNVFSQREIGEYLGLAPTTYISVRTELKKLGLINVSETKPLRIRFNPVQAILFNPTKGREFRYMMNLQNKIKPITTVQVQQIQQQKVIEEKAKEIVKAKEEAKKKEEQRFPMEDYTIVLNAYKRYKGLGLIGAEELRAKHAIKQMFLSRRTVKNIVDCMKFFHDVQDEKGYSWVKFWTLETVMKKMPEFVAGKLQDEDVETPRML